LRRSAVRSKNPGNEGSLVFAKDDTPDTPEEQDLFMILTEVSQNR
jgi:hypothetical protein